MAEHVLPLAQPESVPFRLHTGRQTLLTHTKPGAQSSGFVVHSLPTATWCCVEQSQTVRSLIAMPERPAKNTQLKLARAVAQVALPVGLHASMGGEQKCKFSTGVSLESQMPVAEQRLLSPHSSSVWQIL